MRYIGLFISSLCCIAAVAARAEAPLTVVSVTDSYDVQSDGTYVDLYRVAMRVANDAMARRQGQQAFSYSPQQESLEVTEAYTQKPDGRVVRAGADAIRDQLPPGSADRSLITDLREKLVVFPEVAGGDTLVYELRRTVRHALLPGQFMLAAYLARGVPLLDYRLTVRAPRGLALRTEQHDLEYGEQAEGAAIVRHWHGAVPSGDDEVAAVGPYDRLPRVFVSTEADYASLARDYAALLAPHARVTPAIAALADSVTGATRDRREQARLLYEWVDSHIRYVALYLGDGALEPHDAEAVVAHGWGDCKDHVVLLQALLTARGITSEPVMLNLGNHYTLSDPPTFAQLNHLITYMPDFDLYVDSTATLAPFGTLPFSEYGKRVVHAVMTGPVERRIPSLAPGVASIALRTIATLRTDGSIAGTTTTTATGPFAIDLRRDAAWIQATGPAAAAEQLHALGSDGSGNFAFDPPERLSSSYTVSGDFTLDAQPELLDGDSFAPPAGLQLLAHAGDLLIGPVSMRGLPESQPTPCYPGREVEDVSLTLPPGRHLLRLPRDVAVTYDAASYVSTWSVAGGTVTHHSELVSHVTDVLCDAGLRHATATMLDTIRRAQRMHVALSDE